MPGTQMRTHVEIDGRDFVLAPDQDLVDVMARIEEAARSEPTFIDIPSDEQSASVLISSRTRVVVFVEKVGSALPLADLPLAPVPEWDL